MVNHWSSRLVLAVLFLLLLSSCLGGEEGVLLEENFGNPDSGWGDDSQEAFDRGYQEGEYFVEVYEDDWFVWVPSGNRFTDIDIEVEARQIPNSSDGHFGLICRYDRPDNFYYFAVTADGYYAVYRVENGEPEMLSGEGFLYSPAIRADEGVFHLRVACHADNLSMYVADQRVATVFDDLFPRGDVGLAVGSIGGGGSIRVHFDDLVVAVPEVRP
jgi:hypothetical protein